MNWMHFLLSAILGAGLVFKMGAPVPPVAAGLALAAFLIWKGQGRPFCRLKKP